MTTDDYDSFVKRGRAVKLTIGKTNYIIDPICIANKIPPKILENPNLVSKVIGFELQGEILLPYKEIVDSRTLGFSRDYATRYTTENAMEDCLIF
ncbi:MAG: hypothetical protein KJ767_01275 [Nanoarchaeota archaeon]|nr:hypothetical protein [Nanoarchaeota archaeon]